MESEKGLQILSWDDSYGCLIVQELNIALTHQNVSLYQPICCENHLKLHPVWSLGTGVIHTHTHTHIVLFFPTGKNAVLVKLDVARVPGL